MTHPGKAIVINLVEQVINNGRMELIEQLYAPNLASAARRWITSFRDSFPDVHMTIVDLIAEDEKVVGQFTCSATHLGPWRGHPATGRRFEHVDEISIFHIRNNTIVHAWSLEDTLDRMTQLGLR